MGVIWNRERFKNISYVKATSQVEEYIMGRSLDSRSLIAKNMEREWKNKLSEGILIYHLYR